MGKFDGMGWPADEVADANARHEEFMILAREAMDKAGNDFYRANGMLRRRFAKTYPDEPRMHEREAANLIADVLAERGLL